VPTGRLVITVAPTMIAIDLALLAGGALLVVVIAGFVGGRVGRRVERKQLGARNAAEEKRRLEERCAICGEAIEPAIDVWDRGQWWHRACYREALQ
jgi:hypothetical protein